MALQVPCEPSNKGFRAGHFKDRAGSKKIEGLRFRVLRGTAGNSKTTGLTALLVLGSFK